MKHTIHIEIYSAKKPGDITKTGPERFDEFTGAVGISELDSRPEGPTVSDLLPEAWRTEANAGNVPYRKAVEIDLPVGVECGAYKVGSVELYGLHSKMHSADDGMGSTVYAYAKGTRLLADGENREQAIDSAIESGIILLVPGPDGKRHETEAKILSVSKMHGNKMV